MTTPLQKGEQLARRLIQQPFRRKVGLLNQLLGQRKITETEGHMGIGAQHQRRPQIPRRFDDRQTVGATALPGVAQGGVIHLEGHLMLNNSSLCHSRQGSRSKEELFTSRAT